MIRAILVATILVLFSVQAMPCWTGQESQAAVESWARAKAVSDTKYRVSEAIPQIGRRWFEATVQAVPDQAAVIDSA
jgi:hypothetical protein